MGVLDRLSRLSVPTVSEKKAKKTLALARGKLSITKDPRFYAESIPAVQLPYKRVLGLDLGTNCGVAFADIVPGRQVKDAPITVGQWDLSVGSFDSGVLRFIRLKQFLSLVCPSLICYEEVRFTPDAGLMASRNIGAILARAATASELIGGFKTTLVTWAEERNIPIQGVGISEIKRYATGKGVADKPTMIAAANARFGISLDAEGYETAGDDNMADAAWICAMAVDRYSEGLNDTPATNGDGDEKG